MFNLNQFKTSVLQPINIFLNIDFHYVFCLQFVINLTYVNIQSKDFDGIKTVMEIERSSKQTKRVFLVCKLFECALFSVRVRLSELSINFNHANIPIPQISFNSSTYNTKNSHASPPPAYLTRKPATIKGNQVKDLNMNNDVVCVPLCPCQTFVNDLLTPMLFSYLFPFYNKFLAITDKDAHNSDPLPYIALKQ